MKSIFLLCITLMLLTTESYAQVVTTTSGGIVVATSGKPVTVGPTSRVSLVATATILPNTLNSTASQACMTRKAHFNRSTTTKFQAYFPCWYVDTNTNNTLGAEIAPGNACSVKAWLEYPVGVYTQFLFSGSSSAVIIANGTTQASDFLTVAVPDGAQFYTWTYITGSGGNNFGYYLTAQIGNPLDGTLEKADCATSGVPTSPGAMSDNNSGRRGYWPAAITGDTTQPTFALIGDSRTTGTSDVEDATFDLGNLARSVGAVYAYANLGVSGRRMSSYLSSNTLEEALLSSLNVSAIISELGTNEYNQFSSSIANWEVSSQNLAAHFVNLHPTVPVFRSTMEPWTTSTDTFATPTPPNWGVTCSNQTGASYNANQTTENGHIRTASFDSLPYVELANAVTTATDSGCWKANGIASFYTSGGGHETQAGNKLIVSAGTINPRTIAATSPISYTYPTFNLTGTAPSYTNSGPPLTGSPQAAIMASHPLTAGNVTMPANATVTIEGWVFISSLPGGTVNPFGGVGNPSIAIGTTPNSFVGYSTGCGGTNFGTTSFTASAWHHMAFVLQAGLTTTSTFTLYLDGVSAETTSGTFNTGCLQPVGFNIGPGSFNGNVAEVAVFNYAKYTGNFTPPTDPYTGNESGLVGLWHLNGSVAGIRGPAAL